VRLIIGLIIGHWASKFFWAFEFIFIFEFEPFVEPLLTKLQRWIPLLGWYPFWRVRISNIQLVRIELGLGQIFRTLNTKTQFQAFLKAFRNPSLLVGYSDNLKKKKGKGCVIWACFSSVFDQLWTCFLSFFLSFFLLAKQFNTSCCCYAEFCHFSK